MATARKSKKLNKAWLHDHLNDPYVKLAQREGYRARAAYKLKEIDEQLHLLRAGPARRRPRRRAGRLEPVRAAQVRARRAPPAPTRPARSRARIIALDMLEFEPIDGVDFIHGDFREAAVLAALEARARPAGRSTSCSRTWRPTCRASPRPMRRGWPTWSSWRSSSPRRHLRPEGALVCKVFHGSGYSQLVEAVQGRVSDRQADQAQGLAGQVGRNLSRRHRSQAACIRVRYSRVAALCPGRYTRRGPGLDWTKIGRRCRGWRPSGSAGPFRRPLEMESR